MRLIFASARAGWQGEVAPVRRAGPRVQRTGNV